MVRSNAVMLMWTKLRGPSELGILSTLVLAGCAGLVGCTGDAFFTGDGSGGSAAGNTGAASSGGSGAQGTGGDDSGGFGTGGLGEACPGGVCVPAAPAGWEGPVALVESGTGPVSCSGDYPIKSALLVADATGADAECAACSCGDPQNQGCNVGAGIGYDSADCDGVMTNLPALGDGCKAVPAGTVNSIMYPGGTLGPVGTCSPQGGGVSGLPSAFGTDVTLCEVAGAAPSCDDEGGACLPFPDSPFAQTLCVYIEQDVECPDGPYSKQHSYDKAGQDLRGCSDCDCESPQAGSACGLTIDAYSASGCDSGFLEAGLAGTCINAAVTGGGLRGAEHEPVACYASGGEPVGQAKLGNQITMCCIDGG